MWRDAALVAGKDLRIEARSRVATNQVAPFALDPNRAVLKQAAAGLYWVAVLFCSLLAVQRSSAVESAEGARDQLRLSGLDPAGVFLGKAAAPGLPVSDAPASPSPAVPADPSGPPTAETDPAALHEAAHVA